MAASAAAAALARLREVTRRADRPVVFTPPAMVPAWQAAYAEEVRAATAAALAAGAAAERVHALLAAAAARDLDSLPLDLLALCVQAGLSADTDVRSPSGESLLHLLLNAPHPLPLGNLDGAWQGAAGESQQVAEQLQQLQQQLQGSIPQQEHPACGGVTLAELLRRPSPSPNLTDLHGNTALHILVACMITKRHFPDPKAGEGQQQPGEQRPGAPSPPEAAALQDHDAARAAYAAAAFAALLQAGWHPALRNANGYTVTDLLQEGLTRYQTELRELQDPEGVAQQTVAMLEQRAPSKELREFLAAKVAGVEAVVDALQLMQALAARAEAPRKARSAATLVLLWLLLLAVCLWGLWLRRH